MEDYEKSLIDIEGFNNGDFYEIHGDIYILIGENLYGINNNHIIKAKSELVNKINKINILEYIISSDHIKIDNNYDIDSLLDELLRFSYKCFITRETFKNGAKDILSVDITNSEYETIDSIFRFELGSNLNRTHNTLFKDRITIEGYDNQYRYRTLKTILKGTPEFDEFIKNNVIDEDWEKTEEAINNYVNSDIYKEHEKLYLEAEKRDNEHFEQYSKSMDYYIDNYGDIDDVIKRIKKNGKVLHQLKSGTSLLYLFIMNDCKFNVDNWKKEYISKLHINDYSFLIMNFIKAVECMIAYKLSKFDDSITIFIKEIKDKAPVKLNSNEFKNNAMLGDMIGYIYDHQEYVIDNKFNNESKQKFINVLKTWKDNDRNGYFHKDVIKNIDDVFKIISSTLELLVCIEVYIKKID